MANSSILFETVRNIYKQFGCSDEISDVTVFQDPRIFQRNHDNCDICFPLISHGGVNASIPGVFLFPQYKQFKVTVNIQKVQKELLEASKSWILPIKLCTASSTSLCIQLDREKAFRNVIHQVIFGGDTFGKLSYMGKALSLTRDSTPEDQDHMDLTQLRTDLAFKCLCNVFNYLGYNVLTECSPDNSLEDVQEFHVCLKAKCSAKDPSSSLVPCGAVLDIATGVKATNVCAKDYYRKKRIVFEEMALGRDIPNDNINQITSLANAEVTVELLSVKLHEHVSISLSEDTDTIGITRGASFLLYNHVRISSIRKKFEKDVERGLYPKLPNIEDIDFGLLTHNEEWELLLLILKLPSWVVTCIGPKGKISLHSILIGLDKLCRTFSVYYRRVRILTEPRVHLLAVMNARLYLLHCLEVILRIGFLIFDLKPLDYM